MHGQIVLASDCEPLGGQSRGRHAGSHWLWGRSIESLIDQYCCSSYPTGIQRLRSDAPHSISRVIPYLRYPRSSRAKRSRNDITDTRASGGSLGTNQLTGVGLMSWVVSWHDHLTRLPRTNILVPNFGGGTQRVPRILEHGLDDAPADSSHLAVASRHLLGSFCSTMLWS